jgi:hypothetical protein
MISTKRLISTAFLAVSVLAGQCAFGTESAVTLHVPFAFVVAGRTLPAAAYIVEANGSVVYIHGGGNSVLVTGLPQSQPRYAKPGLIFAQRGGKSYLIGVQTEDDGFSIGSTPK